MPYPIKHRRNFKRRVEKIINQFFNSAEQYSSVLSTEIDMQTVDITPTKDGAKLQDYETRKKYFMCGISVCDGETGEDRVVAFGEIEVHAVVRTDGDYRCLDNIRIVRVFAGKRNCLAVEGDFPVVSAGADDDRIAIGGYVHRIGDIVKVRGSVVIDGYCCRLQRKNRQ